MAQRDRKNIKKALCAKGFIEENNDHYFYTFVYRNKITPIFTKLSKGSDYKTIRQGLLSLMSKQLKLSNKEFLDFIDCNLTLDKYIEIMKTRIGNF